MSKQSHGLLASKEFNLEASKRRLRLEDNQISKVNNISIESRKEIFDLFINIDQQQLLDMTYLKEQVSYIRSIRKSVYLKHDKKDIGPDIAAFLIRVPNTVTKICSRIEDEEKNATKPKACVGCPVKIDRDVIRKCIAENKKQTPVTSHTISAMSVQLFHHKTSAEYIRKVIKNTEGIEIKKAVVTEKKRAELDTNKLKLYIDNCTSILKNVRPKLFLMQINLVTMNG